MDGYAYGHDPRVSKRFLKKSLFMIFNNYSFKVKQIICYSNSRFILAYMDGSNAVTLRGGQFVPEHPLYD